MGARADASDGEAAQLRSALHKAREEANRQAEESRLAIAGLEDERQRERAEAELKITRYRAAVERADALISAAVAERPGRWERIGRSLGVSRLPQAWLALSGWTSPEAAEPPAPSAPVQHSPQKTTNPSQAAPEMKNPYLRATSLRELLSWDDVDFVRCAYVTVLGRQPDPEGEAYYTDRIRRGHSKMEVLWQLRRSPEGPSHDPGIAGLDRALKRAAWARKPVVGWVLAMVGVGEGEAPSWQRHRVLSNELVRLRKEIFARSEAIEIAVQQNARELSTLRSLMERPAGGISKATCSDTAQKPAETAPNPAPAVPASVAAQINGDEPRQLSNAARKLYRLLLAR
jgi:hypothetical protein